MADEVSPTGHRHQGRTPPDVPPREAVREALTRLGVDDLVLGIHEAALPSRPGAETGRGSLPSKGGQRFLERTHRLGFDAVLLGPSGMTDRGNPSPYDGTLFSMNVMAADLEGLAQDPEWSGLLDAAEVEALLRTAPPSASSRVPVEWAFDVHREATNRVAGRFLRQESRARWRGLSRRFRAFVARESHWLDGDALYHALALRHGAEDWREWPEPVDRNLWCPAPGLEGSAAARRAQAEELLAEAIDAWRFTQFLLHEQRERARGQLAEIGLALYGDVQVGMSLRDEWRLRKLFLPGYRMGAPPSRTNPEGQPWGYPVFHPARVFADGTPPSRWPIGDPKAEPGPVLRFLRERFARAFAHYDALRIDHPHGLICPWVYREGAYDPYRAVREGARLLSSPDLPDHPDLAPWAIPEPHRIDGSMARWSDERVAELSPDQVSRYGVLLDRALEAARRAGSTPRRLICEVLSTMPRPLAEVMTRHGMGRFRVTHKADPHDPADVYHADNARAHDWVMMTTQDTPPIWSVMQDWSRSGEIADRAARLAARLTPEDCPARQRESLTAQLRADPGALATGMLAELFACPARHVMVFFTDLIGLDEPYNRPGVDDPRNWTLRARPMEEAGTFPPPLDIGRACAMALRARRNAPESLLHTLERQPAR